VENCKNSQKPGAKIGKIILEIVDIASGVPGVSKFVADIFEKENSF